MEFSTWLRGLGWTEDRQRELEGLGDPDLVAARVAVAHRGAYGLLGGSGVTSARLAGRFRHDSAGPEDWPAVGDWVAVREVWNPLRVPGRTSDEGLIQHVLARTTLLSRRRPMLQEAQVIAANVDVAFVVTSPGADLSPRRVERYLAAIRAGGARPVVVLNKVDLADDLPGVLGTLAVAAAGVTCVACSAASGSGLEELRANIPAGGTIVLVGSSGVGKSSLLNRLLGDERQATRTVRVTDDKGRHTTTRRELLELPGGAWAIDTPGMRELGLWEAGEGIGETFEDIEAIARGCRFRDCGHQGEPGCAVAEAVAQGAVPPERLASLEKLRKEQAFVQRQLDWRSADNTKRRWKAVHKGIRARRKVDPKLRDE